MVKKYNPIYDAYFDDISDCWLEKKCPDKDCEFCKDRPDKPSMATGKCIDKLFHRK